ncbi:MAG: IS66 family transposase [Planctomycetota bacterium]
MTLADAHAQLADRDAQLAARDVQLSERNGQLTERAREIDTLKTELSTQAAMIKQLREQVAKLSELLGQHSGNSHLPPSSDAPGKRNNPDKGNKDRRRSHKPKRKRGGQKGHRGAHRELLPEEQVGRFVDFFPEQCEHCAAALPRRANCCSPKRYQIIELPEFKPDVTEYRRYAVDCESCGRETLAEYDAEKIPQTAFGPRLMSTLATLTGVYHISRRRTVALLSDFLGVRISLGAVSTVEARVSEALKPAYDEAWAEVQKGEVKYTDGTTWLQASSLLTLWTIATAVATVFKVLANGTKKTLEPLYGAQYGILVSDRASSLNFWAMERRQICWAHVLRKFISFSERDGPAGGMGKQLLDYTGIMFEYWHQYKDGKLSRARFVEYMAILGPQVETLLERVVAKDIPRMSGSCANLLQHRSALWTFVHHDGVEPTNNHAERELQGFVLWRRRSFGTQSERGNVFAQRIMTVAHTAKKQGKNVFGFIRACCEAKNAGTTMPALIETKAS